MKAGNEFFAEASAGSPFYVYAPGKYKNEEVKVWNYAVTAGDELKDNWNVNDFENGHYRLRVYGPNGFFREFSGIKNDGAIDVKMKYEQVNGKPTGNIILELVNKAIGSKGIIITDNSYKAATIEQTIEGTASKEITLDMSKTFGWYDLSIKLKDSASFERRYAGRVETGSSSKTDPLMGKAV
jgi:phospholipase C